VSAYGVFYAGEPLKNFPLDALILALFIPLFPISLITSYLIRRFWIYSYPLVAILGLISFEFIKIPNYEFLYYLASFTLLFHSVRTLVSQSFKEGISELHPALLSLIWLSKEETHFIFLLLPSALLYLLGIYTKRMLHTDSFYYAGGFIGKDAHLFPFVSDRLFARHALHPLCQASIHSLMHSWKPMSYRQLC
jgi:NADH-quinone oxidoreductase subunit L